MSTQHDERMMRLARELPGWSIPDILAARKCARKIHRADEMRCTVEIWQNDDGQWVGPHGRPCRSPYGRALSELCDIVARYPGWVWYHQTDPRGRSVYLLSPEVLGEMEAQGVALDAGYNRGVAL